MYVNSPARFAGLGGALAALSLTCVSATADEAIYVEDSASAMVVISSDATSDPPPAPASSTAETSELIVHDADPPRPEATAPAPAAAAARGDLTVVANQPKTAAVRSVIADPAVVPAGGMQPPNLNAILGAGPRRPGMSSGIRSPQPAMRYAPATSLSGPPQVRTIVAPTTARGLASSPAAPAPSPPPSGTERVVRYDVNSRPPAAKAAPNAATERSKQLLVRSYLLSLKASQESEYSEIVTCCADARRGGLDAESQSFSRHLSAWALNRRGQLRADEGQRELALADFRAALEFNAGNWRALHNKAVTLAQGGQFADAFDDLTRVIAMNPRFAKAFSNRATLYVQAGDFERALTDYDMAIELEPTLTAALVGRGRVCHMQGQLDEALASLDSAVKCEPNDADIVCSRADLLADLGRYRDALQDYARAIDLNPKLEHAYRNGAWLLATCPDAEVRDADGALAGAKAALECGYGDRHAALDTLAAAQANAGQFAEAVATVRQAIDIAPQESRPAYEERLKLYEAQTPFRTRPVGGAVAGAPPSNWTAESTARTAEYVDE